MLIKYVTLWTSMVLSRFKNLNVILCLIFCLCGPTQMQWNFWIRFRIWLICLSLCKVLLSLVPLSMLHWSVSLEQINREIKISRRERQWSLAVLFVMFLYTKRLRFQNDNENMKTTRWSAMIKIVMQNNASQICNNVLFLCIVFL